MITVFIPTKPSDFRCPLVKDSGYHGEVRRSGGGLVSLFILTENAHRRRPVWSEAVAAIEPAGLQLPVGGEPDCWMDGSLKSQLSFMLGAIKHESSLQQ